MRRLLPLLLLLPTLALGVEVKPEINGNYTSSCAPTEECPTFGAGAVPGGAFNGLISIEDNKQYIRVRDVSLQDTAALCLAAKGDYQHIVNITCSYAAITGIRAASGAETHFWVQDSSTDQIHMCSKYGAENDTSRCRAGAVAIGSNEVDNVYLLNNVSTRNYNREAFGCYQANNCVMRGNFAANADELFFPAGSQHVLIENNRGTGDEGIDFTLGNGTFRAVSETTVQCVQTDRTIYRNNSLAAGSVFQRAQFGGCPGGTQYGAAFYNNSSLHASQAGFDINNNSGSLVFLGVADNLFHDRGGSASPCTDVPTSAAFDFGNNAWRVTPSDTDCQGTGDITTGDTYNLSGGSSLANWQAYDYSNPTEAADFTPSGSPLLHTGRGWRTKTNGSGSSSTSVVVNDSRWFSDGWDVGDDFFNTADNPNAASGKIVEGDTIVVGTDTVTITDINYSTHTLTVTPAITWADDEDVCYQTCTVNIGYDPDIAP